MTARMLAFAAVVLLLAAATTSRAQIVGYQPNGFTPIQPQPQRGPPCGHYGTPACPVEQSGPIDIPGDASSDQLYQMSLDAQRRRDVSAKMQYLQRAAELGQVNAMTGYGYDLVYANGVGRDVRQGLAWLTRAAAQGHAAAEWQLGTIYDNGDYVPHDGAKALRLISAAAAQHHADAEDWMGINDELGRNGVAHNRALAIQYLNRSATDGQNGMPQRMAAYLGRPGTPRFSSFAQLSAGFSAAFNADYAAFYGRHGPSGGGPNLTESGCRSIYASTACQSSSYRDVFRSNNDTNPPPSSGSSEP